MTPADVFKEYGPSVANIIATNGQIRVASGSGFVVNRRMVTCAHVVNLPPGLNVEVRFGAVVAQQSREWVYPAFGQRPNIKGYSDEHSYDYAIIEPPSGAILGSSLQFAEDVPEVGEPVCCLGYPFEDPDLTLHHGFISAIFQSGVATMIKLDMSINPSNSGGPLIRLKDGAVVGVVARKATGLSRAFAGLMRSYDQNISALQRSIGLVGLGSVDPIAALVAGQRQMKSVSEEIARSANVGIGYAIFPSPLKEEPALS
ncbi:MAG: serine protease [Caulobacteraceae bacterium]